MNLDFGQIITQIIAFLIMLWVLKKYGWTPLLNILDERQDKIQNEFDEIARQKQEEQKLIDEYQLKIKNIEIEARHKLQESIAQGQKISLEIQAETQEKTKQMLNKAQEEVLREIEQAKNQLKNDVVKMVMCVTEKILQQKLDPATQKKLIEDFVQEAELK